MNEAELAQQAVGMSAEWITTGIAILAFLAGAAGVIASYARMGGKIETRMENFEKRMDYFNEKLNETGEVVASYGNASGVAQTRLTTIESGMKEDREIIHGRIDETKTTMNDHGERLTRIETLHSARHPDGGVPS